MIDADRWTRHSRMSDPANYAACLAALPSDVSALNRVVQGLVIHLDWLSAYDVDDRQLRGNPRETLPVADRLAAILEGDARPLNVPRSPREKSAGTCRDFSLMACSFLRDKGVPSRLRCGFASYLGECWEDHWVCEYRDGPAQPWRLSDPQIDEVMRTRLRNRLRPCKRSADIVPHGRRGLDGVSRRTVRSSAVRPGRRDRLLVPERQRPTRSLRPERQGDLRLGRMANGASGKSPDEGPRY